MHILNIHGPGDVRLDERVPPTSIYRPCLSMR